MLNRIFPKEFDNNYSGHRLAIWLVIPITLVRLMMGFNCVVFTRFVATGDGILLPSYNAASTETLISLFALLGLSDLLLALLSLVVLIRYRAMIAFTYLLLSIDELGSRAILLVHPTARSGAATAGDLSIPSAISFAILAVTLVGFVLSLRNKADSR
jgi:hypothetical protein